MDNDAWKFDDLIQHLTDIYNENGGDNTCTGIYLDGDGESEYERVGHSLTINMNFDLDLPQKYKSKKKYKPVICANWILVKDVFPYYSCSNCGCNTQYNTRYCWGCGAEMSKDIVESIEVKSDDGAEF